MAFLNLHNGRVKELDYWHWVTITALEDTTAVILDSGSALRIDLRLWYETTKRRGGYVACGPGKGAIPADTAALAIIPRTLAAIYGENRDKENEESRPEDIRAENLYSGKIGAGLLVALWGISWKQRVILPELLTFEPPSSYPRNPDGTPNLDAEDVPVPWNDPLGEFLRLGLTVKTEPDASGQSQTYSDDIVAVRGEDNG